MNKFKMELVWHNCETYPPKEDYNDYLIVSDGVGVCEVRWDKEEGFSYFSKQFGYRPLVGNYKKMWWADVRQTAQNDSRFRGLIVDDLVAIVDDITAEEIEEYMKSATKKMITDYVDKYTD